MTKSITYSNIHSLANQPSETLSKYTKLDHIYERRLKIEPVKLTTCVALAFTAAIFFKTNKFASGGLIISAGYLLYSAVSYKLFETEEYVQQKEEFSALFDPSLNCLYEAYHTKSKAIFNAVHTIEMDSIEEVQTSVQIVADVYDRIKDPGMWTKKTVDNNPIDDESYKTLKADAKKLADLQVDAITKDLGSVVNQEIHQKMGTLQKAARLFVNGAKKNDQLGKDQYVEYSLKNKKAIINDPKNLQFWSSV